MASIVEDLGTRQLGGYSHAGGRLPLERYGIGEMRSDHLGFGAGFRQRRKGLALVWSSDH